MLDYCLFSFLRPTKVTKLLLFNIKWLFRNGFQSDSEMVKNPFEIEEEENADAEEEMDDDGSSSGGSDVSRKGEGEQCHDRVP